MKNKAVKIKVGRKLKPTLPMLKMIHEAKDGTRRNVMSCCSRDICEAMTEIAKNMLKGNIPLTETQYSTLRRYVRDMELLADKKSTLRDKRQTLQKGGFLGALLGPALKILSPVVGTIASSILPSLTGGMQG